MKEIKLVHRIKMKMKIRETLDRLEELEELKDKFEELKKVEDDYLLIKDFTLNFAYYLREHYFSDSQGDKKYLWKSELDGHFENYIRHYIKN